MTSKAPVLRHKSGKASTSTLAQKRQSKHQHLAQKRQTKNQYLAQFAFIQICQRSSIGAWHAPSCTSTVFTVWSTVLPSTRYSSIHVRYTIAIRSSYTLLWCRVCPRHLIAPGNLQAKYPDALHCMLIPGKLDWRTGPEHRTDPGLYLFVVKYYDRIINTQ